MKFNNNYSDNEELKEYFKSGCSAKKTFDAIAKPIGSLGIIEENIIKICSIFEDYKTPSIEKRALVVMCADHGVVSEGVTQTGSEVTRIVSENFANGNSSVNYMARRTSTDVFAIDIGIDCPKYDSSELKTCVVVDRKVKRGTSNLIKDDAMTVEECQKAIRVGIDVVGELKNQGYRLIATGEMGIGNTTPTSILAGALLNKKAEEVTGIGAGIDEEGFLKKIDVIRRGIEKVTENKDLKPIEVLAKVGGLEIAGMTGMFLGGIQYKIPIVIDGVISAVAAYMAYMMDDRTPLYAIASHVSKEPAGQILLDSMGLKPMIHGEMRLGEGSGAITLIPILDMGCDIYNNMGTFENFNITPYKIENVEKIYKE